MLRTDLAGYATEPEALDGLRATAHTHPGAQPQPTGTAADSTTGFR
jgi:hypothetical protein